MIHAGDFCMSMLLHMRVSLGTFSCLVTTCLPLYFAGRHTKCLHLIQRLLRDVWHLASVRREVPPALLALKTKLVSFELAVPCTEAGLQVFKGPCKIPFDNAN